MSAVAEAPVGYTINDLDWARAQLGARVELDQWGNLIVSPATLPHDLAVGILQALLIGQTDLPEGHVLAHSPAWRPRGGSGYTNVPNVTVLPATWQPVAEADFDPAPLLVAEVASPGTRHRDRTSKREDYRTGGAGLYLLMDLPGLAPVDEPTLTLHDYGASAEDPVVATEVLTFELAGSTVRVDPAELAGPGWPPEGDSLSRD